MNLDQGGGCELTGRLYPDGALCSVRVENGTIADARPLKSMAPGAAQQWIIPGFYDLQVNGFAGRNFIDPRVTPDDVRHIAEAVLRTGTTRFLPTIITASLETLCHQLEVIAEAIEQDPLVQAMCPGIHVEGPFIHPEDGPRGAHPREHVRPPSIPDFERLWSAARGHIALLTLAADQPGSPELVRHAAGRGVLVSIGHHRPGLEQIEAAVAAGARLCTHLGNGSDAVLPRHNNYIWQQLADDRLCATFITDGHHLPPWTVRVMLRAKGIERSVLITDAMGAAGMPAGRYRLGEADVERTPDGKVVLPGTPYLAGSAADMPLIVARAVKDGGATFPDAITMAALRPEAVLGTSPAWSCVPGAPANLCEVRWHEERGDLEIRKAAIGAFSATAG